MNYILQAENVSKNYLNKTALKSFNINVPEGSIYGILGPNGAGKTTFLRIVNQITAPDSGSIYFSQEPLNQKHISQIGYMPEERGLYKNMAIGEQCLYLAQLKGLSKAQAKQKLDFWFDKLSIEKWWKRKLSELSKGMAQKIQFVVTVLHEPKLLIFDEPFSGFDPVNSNLIRDEILRLRNDGATILFSTHRMESVEELCDRVCLIHQSEKILDDDIHTIKNQHKEGRFYVEFNELSLEKLNQITDTFKIEEQHINNNSSRITLRNSKTSAHELIQTLSEMGQITTFYEIIPSMSDIFIKTIEGLTD